MSGMEKLGNLTHVVSWTSGGFTIFMIVAGALGLALCCLRNNSKKMGLKVNIGKKETTEEDSISN